jgi:hypothetical protein
MASSARKLQSVGATVGDELDARDEERRSLNIAQRINAAMADVDYVQKEQPKDNGMKYSFVSHDAVTRKVRPILHKHGIVYYPHSLDVRQSGNRTEAVFMVRFENIDNRADYIDVSTFGYGVDGQDKGPGKAMSYGVKYALLKVLGLETGDDPENEQGSTANHDPNAADPGFITAKQRDDLEALASEVGADIPRFCNYFGVRTLSQIPEGRYQAAVDALKAKKKEPANV